MNSPKKVSPHSNVQKQTHSHNHRPSIIHWNSFLVRKVVLIRSRWLSCLTKGSSHERFAVRRFFSCFSSRPRRPIILVYSEVKTCWLIEVQAESFSPSSNGARWISPDFLQEKHPTEKTGKSMNSVEWIINGNRKPFDRWKSTQKSYFGWNKRPETIFSNQLTRFIRTKAHRHTDSGPNNEHWLNLEKFYEHFFFFLLFLLLFFIFAIRSRIWWLLWKFTEGSRRGIHPDRQSLY